MTTTTPTVAPRRRAERTRVTLHTPAALRWVLRAVAVVVIAAALLVIAVAVVVPRLGGATPYTILTGSMRPDLPPGTMVVAKPVDPERVGIGAVVTYQLRSGDPQVVTHRVVAVGTTMEGELRFTTQGDANDVADEAPVLPEQIRGELWYAVPHLGRLTSVLDVGQRQLAIYVIAAGLVVYGLSMVAGGARERRQRKAAGS